MVSFSTFQGVAASIILLATQVSAQNLISVDIPQPNGNVISKSDVEIAYTVIGTQTVNPVYNINTTYPSSLSVDFVWREHANPNNVISLSVTSGLNTDGYPGGSKNVQRKQSWKAPNCHFFSRYPPTTFDFSLVFTPQYPPVTAGSPLVGTQQSQIVVPLAVTVDNSTFPKC